VDGKHSHVEGCWQYDEAKCPGHKMLGKCALFKS
jgi:hypothetical protein